MVFSYVVIIRVLNIKLLEGITSVSIKSFVFVCVFYCCSLLIFYKLIPDPDPNVFASGSDLKQDLDSNRNREQDLYPINRFASTILIHVLDNYLLDFSERFCFKLMLRLKVSVKCAILSVDSNSSYVNSL